MVLLETPNQSIKLGREWEGTLNPDWEMSVYNAWKVSKYGVISGPYFPVFGLNIQSECRKIRTRNNSVYILKQINSLDSQELLLGIWDSTYLSTTLLLAKWYLRCRLLKLKIESNCIFAVEIIFVILFLVIQTYPGMWKRDLHDSFSV